MKDKTLIKQYKILDTPQLRLVVGDYSKKI